MRSLSTVGLEHLIQDWLGDTTIVMFTLFVIISWKYFGFHMILMLAGLQGIPHEINEAARIDGADRNQVFRYITLPLLGSDAAHLDLPLDHRCPSAVRHGLGDDRRRAAERLVDDGHRHVQGRFHEPSDGLRQRLGGDPVRVCARRRPLVPALRPPARHRRRHHVVRWLSRWRRRPPRPGTFSRRPRENGRFGLWRPTLDGTVVYLAMVVVAATILVPIGYAVLGGFKETGS